MTDIPKLVLAVSLAVALAGVGVWIFQLFSRKSVCDPSPAKGSDSLGVLYAFTIGMLPWKKESATLHWQVYLRGIGFHIGIFAGILALALSIFNVTIPTFVNQALVVMLWLGVLCGLLAILARATEANLRGISGADDYISPALVTLFMSAAALNSMELLGAAYFYIATSVLCLYLPWSKVRHCVYFFFLRGKIGAMMGHRGMLTAPDSHAGKETR
jgi:hypothetical protein